MKIFDWVHRKMQTNMDYRKVPRHKKDAYVDDVGRGLEDRGETKKGETSERAGLLMDLRHAASIQQALDEILTIGTLGHVDHQHLQEVFIDDAGARANPRLEFLSLPLASKLEEQRSSAAAAAEEADQGEKGDHEPAVEAAASAAHPNHHKYVVVESFKKEMLEILGANITGSPGQNGAAGELEGDVLEVPLLQETKASRKERITLADLFMASQDDVVHAGMVAEPTGGLKASRPASARVNVVVPDQKEAKSGANIGTKKAKPSSAPYRAKSAGESNSLTKKLTPWKKEGEDSSAPPQKLQRVIRRMLKKKIHPADQMARDHVNASAPTMLPGCSTVSTGESASLII